MQAADDSADERIAGFVVDVSLRGLRPVFDLGHKLALDPDALVRDALSVWLRFPDQRRQALLQIGSGRGVEP